MRLLLTLIVIVIVLIQSISGSLLVLKYESQKKYIAQKLCENRNNPSSGCAGKCYLKKLLKKNQEAEKALPGSIKEKMEVVYVITFPGPISFNGYFPQHDPEYFYLFTLPQSPLLSDFQPPRV